MELKDLDVVEACSKSGFQCSKNGVFYKNIYNLNIIKSEELSEKLKLKHNNLCEVYDKSVESSTIIADSYYITIIALEKIETLEREHILSNELFKHVVTNQATLPMLNFEGYDKSILENIRDLARDLLNALIYLRQHGYTYRHFSFKDIGVKIVNNRKTYVFYAIEKITPLRSINCHCCRIVKNKRKNKNKKPKLKSICNMYSGAPASIPKAHVCTYQCKPLIHKFRNYSNASIRHRITNVISCYKHNVYVTPLEISDNSDDLYFFVLLLCDICQSRVHIIFKQQNEVYSKENLERTMKNIKEMPFDQNFKDFLFKCYDIDMTTINNLKNLLKHKFLQ